MKIDDAKDTKTLEEKVRVSLSVKEIVGIGSFLIYLGIAIAGYYNLKEQVANSLNDLQKLENDISTILRNLYVVQFKQEESINRLKEVSNKLDAVDRKIDIIGHDIGTMIKRK